MEALQRTRGGGRVRGEEIRQLLSAQFGVAYSLNGVYDRMKRLNMAWISARAISPYADPVAQAEFKKTFSQNVLAAVPPGTPPESTDVWFQDEMRIGQRGTRSRLWARKGSRPRVVRQQPSESAYVVGAACAQRDAAVGRVMPHANTQAMAHHLAAVSQSVPPGRHVVLVLDRPGWHTTTAAAAQPDAVAIACGVA